MKNIKRIILINLLIILLSILFSNASFAKDLSGISDLRSSHNVGNKIYVKTGEEDDTGGAESLEMSDERDHIYCIQHLADADNGWMTVDEYMEIRGNQATAYWNYGNSNRTVYSKYNIALGYLLGQEGWRKGYSMDNDGKTRQQAIHHLLTHDWGTYVNGNNGYSGDYATGSQILLWNKWFDYWYTDRNDSKGFLNRANAEANNGNAHCVTNAKINSTTVASSASEAEVTGPYYLTYSGSISWVCPINQYGEWIKGYKNINGEWTYTENIKFFQDAACTKEYKMTGIPSGAAFYIKNTSGDEIKKIQLKNKDGVDSWLQTDIRTVESNSDVIGPIRVEYKGIIDWICPLNEDSNWIPGYEYVNGKWRYRSNIAFYKDAACTQAIEMTDIPSNTDFYIKNTSGQKIKKINIKLKNNRVYCANIWFLERSDGQAAQRLISATTKTEYYGSTIILNVKPRIGNLTINKKDSITNENITSPAEFKVRTSKGNWLIETNGTYNYDNSNVDSATVYKTNNGTITLNNLLYDTYEIFETKAPNGYDISKQNGYDSTNKWVNCGKLSLNGENLTIDIKNDLIISVAGIVWVEGKPDKSSDKEYDSLYNKNIDYNVKDVTVKLMSKDKNDNNPIETTKTDEDGKYIFKDVIKKKETDKYYVVFEYSSKYPGHIPVAFYSTLQNQPKENSSKALVYELPTNDGDLNDAQKKYEATTYAGTDSNKIATYGLENVGTYDEKTLTLGNINLGIKPLITPQYDVRENLADLKINIKGYTYTYNYGGRSKIDDKFEVPIVKWQSSGYTRPVYPSDIIYSGKENAKEALEAIVTYRIDVTNNATYNIPELYQQDDTLILTSMVNEFDTNRYTLIEDDTWKLENNKAVIRSLSIINGKDGGIKLSDAKAKTNTVYIKFKVNKNAINDILNHPNGIMEDYPTKVITNGYHTYFRNDYMWKNLEDNNNVKLDNNTHNTRNVEKNSDAPYLVFVPGTDRTVSGTVFKDEIITDNGEKLGDGIYDKDKEKGVAGVKVELLDIEGKTLSHVYQYNKTDKTTKVLDAVTTTDGDGKYSLVGVVPGRYYLKFTYGNGSYKITDLDGNVIKEGNFVTQIGENSISAKDYKSTIINGDIREKFEDRLSEKEENKTQDELNEKYYTWYKDDDFKAKDYSLAVDDLNIRKDINGQEDSINGQSMSPQFSITIENTKANSANEDALENAITKEDVEKTSGNKVNLPILNDGDKNVKNNFGGFHFGIIEQPKQSLEIEKLITNLRLTNAQNNVIFNGNPETAQIVGVTDLDGKSNEGSSYVRVELAEDSIYGSDIEITYQVKITNTSDLNYYNEDYYLYGQADTNKEVLLKPTEVTDYLDKTLTYVEDKTEELNGNKDRVEDTKLKENITIGVKEIKDAQKFNLKDWETLHTSKNKSPSGNTSDKVMIVAERILSNQDDDMEVLSGAKIFSAENTPSDSTPESTEEIKIIRPATIEQAESGATLTITPPTGGNKNDIVIYAISGIISLIILATGISIIKKKVL